MIGQLEEKGDLVEIAILHKKDEYDFRFFKSDSPYTQIDEFQVVRYHLSRVMLAKRSAKVKGSDNFLAALFTA